MEAAIIGSGKIGRGFIGQVLYEAGYELTFIDVSKHLIEQINRHKKYPVYVMGAAEKKFWVKNIKGYTVDEPALIAIKHNIVPEYIIKGILSVMNYGNKEDEQAMQLQNQLREEGVEKVLQTVCGLDCKEPLYDLLVSAYDAR